MDVGKRMVKLGGCCGTVQIPRTEEVGSEKARMLLEGLAVVV